jgi:hypothetical protein
MIGMDSNDRAATIEAARLVNTPAVTASIFPSASAR